MFIELSYLLSMLFTMALICYSLFAVYVLYLDPRAPMNRAFAAMCILMGIWSFAFGVSVSATTLDVAIFWRRIAVIGFGSVYSVLLHMSLILTKKTKRIKGKWLAILLYGPALVNIFLYAMPWSLISYSYVLGMTKFGWMNITEFHLMDWYFYIYYLSFSIAAVIQLMSWYRTCETKAGKRQALIVLVTTTTGVFIASITDIVIVLILKIEMPQIAPLIILIPLVATLYISMVYGLMTPHVEISEIIILKSSVKDMIYRYLASGLIVGAVIAFVFEYFIDGTSLIYSSFLSLVLVLYGVCINRIIASPLKEDHKDSLVLLIIVLLMPFIQYTLGDTADKALWVLPFILMIAFMLYNNSKMMIGIAIGSLLSYTHYWVIMPTRAVVITEKDIFVRVLLLCVGISLSIIINRFFLLKLKENAIQVTNQQLISDISAFLISAGSNNFDVKVDKVLQLIGKHYKVDRAYLFSFNLEGQTMSNTHEWCSEGIESELGSLEDIPITTFPWWVETLKTKQVVNIYSVEKLPDEAKAEREELVRQKIQSTLSVAISIDEKMIGYIGLDSVCKQQKWDESYITNLKIIGNVLSDAFAKNAAEKVIHSMAYYDQLTGLPSRQLFADRLEQTIKRADRAGEKILVVMLDLDGFKGVNDTMGHDVGDELLIHVGRRLEGAVRDSDTVSRFGGDEFLLLCGGIHSNIDAQAVGAEIIEAFREKFILGVDEFNITASLGLAIYPDDGETNEKLVKNADIAMYHAKSNGKNTFALCSSQLKELTQHNVQLTNSLYQAMEAKEFFMCYQPQVNIVSGKVMGVEALIRWRHKDIGLIEPSEFIKIAERNGYILELGEWVLNEVLQQMVKWSSEGYDDFDVAVNISFLQIKSPHFVEMLTRLINQYKVDPTRLEMEITETIAMSEKDHIEAKLGELRAIGIKIAIDDFGTEYSSLGRLKDLTVDKIKIARPFIDGISTRQKDEAIVKSIIALAKNLDVSLIAEGVETIKQRDFLLAEEVEYVQGFFYYHPVMPYEIIPLLKLKGNKS